MQYYEPDLILVTPVLNDWDSFKQLIREVSVLDELQGRRIAVFAVDDGSLNVWEPEDSYLSTVIVEITIISLKANQGHQRAIAIGISKAHEKYPDCDLLVLDSDGEDQPQDISKLMKASSAEVGNIVVAKRMKRTESYLFRAFYQIYRFVFFCLTGRAISFGNFSYIPHFRVDNILFSPGVWNNLAATILRCRIPITFVPTARGNRYFGTSRMNFTSLVIHGMSAIAVFTDIVIGRVMLFLSMTTAVVIPAILAIVVLRVFGGFFVPGYATNLIMLLINFLALTLFIGLMIVLLLLARRDVAATLPSDIAPKMVKDIFVRSYKDLSEVSRSSNLTENH